jgi:hypothetical protein
MLSLKSAAVCRWADTVYCTYGTLGEAELYIDWCYGGVALDSPAEWVPIGNECA